MYMGRLSSVTPIPNLFLTGAWVGIGGGQSAAMLSGRDTARLAKAYLEGKKGTRLMVPDVSLPEYVEVPDLTAEITAVTGGIPAVTLTAVGSGRQVVLNKIGLPTVLIFHTQQTAAASTAVNQAVRHRYPLSSLVMVASVVDLHSNPRLFRRIAKGAMKKTYQQAVATLPRGLSPESYVVILPDWDGVVTKALGLRDVNKTAGVAVLDHAGNVVGVYQGDDPASAALVMLAKAGT